MALFSFTLSFYFGLISTILGYTFVAANKPALSFKINLFRTVLSLTMSIISIPILGFMGAVYSILVSSIIGWTISFWSLRKISIKLSFIKYLFPLFLCLPFMLVSLVEMFLKHKIIASILLLALYLILEVLLFRDFKKLLKYLFDKSKVRINSYFNKE